MGNNVGGEKRAKIMKIDGGFFKIKTPAMAMDVLKDYQSSFVLLESETVKRFGIRAPPLRPEEELKPKGVYFLVELPEFKDESMIVRSRSGTHMGSAQAPVEWLALGSSSGSIRIKMRLPREKIERLMRDGKNDTEVVEGILDLSLKSCVEEDARK